MRDAVKSLMARQAFRFLFAGGLAAAINWLVRFPLAEIMPLTWAIVTAYAIGMYCGFHLYRQFVFPGATRPKSQQALLFVGVNIVGAMVVLGLTLGFLALQAAFAYPDRIKEGLAHGFAIAFGAIFNFLGHKTLTFSLGPRVSP